MGQWSYARADGCVPTRDELIACRDAGMTQSEVAQHFGCGRTSVQRLRRVHGIAWPNRSSIRSHVYVEIDGVRMSLAEAGRRYGLPMSTLAKRWKAGDRGARLVRPRRPVDPNPSHWDLGVSRNEWSAILDYARRRTPVAAARKFGLNEGPVRAALRGEWDRLN